MLCSSSHALKSPFKYEELFPKHWDWWVKNCSTVNNNWYRAMMREAKHREAPILFIRYEDLLVDPEPEVRAMMSFLLGERDLEGTIAERRLAEVLAMDSTSTQTYSLKDTTKQMNVNACHYSKEQIDWVAKN